MLSEVFLCLQGTLLTVAVCFMTSSENNKLPGKMFLFQKNVFMPLSQNLVLLLKAGQKKFCKLRIL